MNVVTRAPLTNVTRRMLGMPEVNTKDVSIHPNRNIKFAHAFQCTSQTPNDANKGILGKRTRKLQARRQSRDMTVAGNNSKGFDAAKSYKTPGSMTK